MLSTHYIVVLTLYFCDLYLEILNIPNNTKNSTLASLLSGP